MFDNIYLRFKYDWPGFWVRLAVNAALCDGPINDKERQALLTFSKGICTFYGINDAERLWRAFSDSPNNPESIKNRSPKQNVRLLSGVMMLMIPVLRCDGLLNDKEQRWVERFQNVTGLDTESLQTIISMYSGREEFINHWEQILEVAPGSSLDTIENAYRIKAKEYHPDKLQTVSFGVRALAEDKLKIINEAYEMLSAMTGRFDKLPLSMYHGGKGKLLTEISPGDGITCPLCTQINRLPEAHRFFIARCGICHGYLAWSEDQYHFMQVLRGH
jgi:hypothetical protein